MLKVRGKKRLLGPPPSFFSEEEEGEGRGELLVQAQDDQMEGIVDHTCKEVEGEETHPKRILIPQTIVNYKNDGLLLVDHDPMAALSIWQRGIIHDTENYLVRDLISQVLLSNDDLLPAIKSAEEVIRIAPGWADGYVTLARAQREFGEPELALDNLKMARSIFQKRLSNLGQELFLEDYPSHPFDSPLEEIQIELLEMEGIVARLEEKRRQYLLKQRTKTSLWNRDMEVCQPCVIQPENAEVVDQQLRRCLQNLIGRVRVVKDLSEIRNDDDEDDNTSREDRDVRWVGGEE